MPVDVGAEHDPRIGLSRQIEDQGLGLGGLLAGFNRQRCARPTARRASQRRRSLGCDPRRGDAIAVLPPRGAGDECPSKRPGDQKADGTRVERGEVFVAPVNRPGNKHRLVPHERDPTLDLGAVLRELLAGSAAEIDDLGGEAPARRGDAAGQRVHRRQRPGRQQQ